jgi:uncharacterized protein (TIGR00290 family)
MLHTLRQSSDVEVVGLLTTVNEEYDRVAMHAVRDDLLRAQAEAIGLPLHRVKLPNPCTDDQYASIMSDFLAEAKKMGVRAMAFGDLYLESVRKYREERLAGTGIEPLFPVWGNPTAELSRKVIEAGFSAIVTCVDPRLIPADLAGHAYDRDFLERLPEGADPCAENGEFHTFVHAGPIFASPLSVRVGEVVERGGFVFADVLPVGDANSGEDRH